MVDDSAQTVQTTETTLDIIHSLRGERGETLSSVARSLDVSKSTARNHLRTLHKHGLVVHEDGVYRLSLEFLDIGERVRTLCSIYEQAAPVIDELADETNEKAQVMVEENGVGYYVYRAKGRGGVDTRDGRRVELHCTSAGKAALAFMDEQHVEHVLNEHGLPRRTNRTITDRDAFFEELETVRERGFAYNDEERLRGLRAIGAPILADDGALLGSISLSGPTTHLRGELFREELPELVVQSADVIHIRSKYA